MDESELRALANEDPVGAVVACLRSYAVHFSAQRDHFSGVLALPPDQRKGFSRGFDANANLFEEQAAMHYAAMQAAVTHRWSRLMSAARAICTTRAESALGVLEDPDERINAIVQAGDELELFRRQHGPPEPRVFRWGAQLEDGELAAIGRVLDENKACIGAARQYADAVGDSFVPYYLAAFRTLLATSLVELTGVESASCVAAISAGDHYDPHRQFVLEAPSRDADGVPLLSRSEIDRVVPAIFGVDVVWAALPPDGPRRERQAHAILVAEVLYEARHKQLVAHAAAFGREVV